MPLLKREVFDYGTAGRRDPFRAGSDSWAGETPSGLTLLGFVVHRDEARSVVAYVEPDTGRRHYLREGERIGGTRIVAIRAEGIETVLDHSERGHTEESFVGSLSKGVDR